MAPLQPSRRDVTGPPNRDAIDLSPTIRHLGSYTRGLDPGFVDGRLATPQPVDNPGALIVGDDGEGGNEGDTADWEDGDRLVVVTPGPQTWVLSFEPIEESLFILWHPRGIARAGVPWTNEQWSITDQTVTLYDPQGLIEEDDAFSAQYQYLTSLEAEPVEDIDFATYAAALLAQSNVSWWDRLGEATGPIGVDETANGHDATITSVTLGQPGLVDDDPDTSALWSAPGRDEVPYGSWMDGPAVSAFCIVKTTNTDLNGITIISRWSSSTGQIFALALENGVLRLRIGPGFTGTFALTGSSGLNDGARHGVGFTFDGTTSRIFTEDGQVGIAATPNTLTAVNTSLIVGADRGGASGSLLHHFAGTLDEPMIDFGSIWGLGIFADLNRLAGIS